MTVSFIQSEITQAEILSGSAQVNGVLDNLSEVSRFNADFMIGWSGISCTYP